MNWTEDEYAAYLQKTGKATPSKPKRSKYGNRRVWVDGIPFDSQKEADYYCGLKLRVKAGEIDGFVYHGKIVVSEGEGQERRAALYEPDFIVLYPGRRYEIIDTKGVETQVFKLKIKGIYDKYPKLEVKTV